MIIKDFFSRTAIQIGGREDQAYSEDTLARLRPASWCCHHMHGTKPEWKTKTFHQRNTSRRIHIGPRPD